MKNLYILLLSALVMAGNYAFSQKDARHEQAAERAKLVNTRVDNNGYWKKWPH